MANVPSLDAAFSSHQIFVQRLAAQFGNEAVPYIDAMNERITAIINGLPKRALSAERQKEIRKKINDIVKEELHGWTSYLASEHREFGGYEASYSARALDDVVEREGWSATVPSIAQVNALAKGSVIKIGEGVYTTYTQMLSDYVTNTAKAMDNAVVNGFATGQTNEQIAQTIITDLDLTTEKAKSNAKIVARNGTNHYSNQARMEMGRQNDDIVIGYRSIGTIDSVTSAQCRYWDGLVRKETDSDWPQFVCPRHSNCRSALSMEIDGRYTYDSESAERPTNFTQAESGKKDPERVSSKKTYYQELDKLDAASQDIALGSPTLGKAYRKMRKDGDQDLFKRQLLDNMYQPLTITEMRKKDNALGRVLKDIPSQ